MSDIFYNPLYNELETVNAINIPAATPLTNLLLYTATNRVILTAVSMIVSNANPLVAGVYGYIQISPPAGGFSRHFYVHQLSSTQWGNWAIGQWNPQMLIDRGGTITLAYANASAVIVGLQVGLSLIGR